MLGISNVISLQIRSILTTSVVLLAMALTGCGGGGSSAAPTVNTGVFLDTTVINIGYRTATLEGVTNALGEYTFLPGETVTFFIGDLVFPPTQATGVVTPLDLAGTQNASNSSVLNMIRLLQTLDKDGDPGNGITITEMAKSSASQVDFDQSISNFESSSSVTTLIMNAGQDSVPTQLVSIANAVAHFEKTLSSNNISFGSLGAMPVNFSVSQLSNTSFYVVFLDDSEVPPRWFLEIFSFDGQKNVTLEEQNGEYMESGTFTVTNGVLNIAFGNSNANIKIISHDQSLNAQIICFDGAVPPLFLQCTGNELEYMFSSFTEANNFFNSK